jgi:hypothetical protein
LDDVLERLLAQIIDFEGNLAARVIEDCLRYADATRLRQSLQSSRNVQPVAIEVAPLNDHIAKVDPDAERDAFSRNQATTTQKRRGDSSIRDRWQLCMERCAISAMLLPLPRSSRWP